MDKNKIIRVYGTLKNHTVNEDIADFNPNNKTTCENDNTGHNDAIAYAYQIYDNRFHLYKRNNDCELEEDTNFKSYERFQDRINKRVNNIRYINNDPNCEDATVIDSNIYIDCPCLLEKDSSTDTNNSCSCCENCNCCCGCCNKKEDPLKNKFKLQELLCEIYNRLNAIDEKIEDIENKVTNITKKVNNLEANAFINGNVNDKTITLTRTDPSDRPFSFDISSSNNSGDCLWKEVEGGIIPTKNTAKVYSSNGFYDKSVTE